jgi:adenylate kinase
MHRLCLILFGAPGSGKGTQAKLLKQELELPHISTGDMLRERVARKDALGRQVEGLLQAGTLVPDATVNQLVKDRIAEPDCHRGFILDGYPRTVSQAQMLTGMLKADSELDTIVVHLRVDNAVIVARIAGRRQCPTCGNVYSWSPNSPTVSEVCDYDGSRLMIRDDDREEVVSERLKAYDRQTAPVLGYFTGEGFPCIAVDGAMPGGPQVIARKVIAQIKELCGAYEAAGGTAGDPK